MTMDNLLFLPDWFQPYLRPFTTLSYPTSPPNNPDSFPDTKYYATGLLDGCFVIAWIAVLALLREFVRLIILEPFARKWLASRAARKQGAMTPHQIQAPSTPTESEKKSEHLDLRSRSGNIIKTQHTEQQVKLEKITKQRQKGMTKEQWLRERSALRFAEQGWSFVYYSIYWSFGLYIHVHLPHSPFNPKYLWLDYPHTPLAGPIKFYYLTQFACWIHQLLILNAEARRKDHWQMMSHHLITIALLLASYFTNFTRVGCLIMLIMDWCDIWLPFAKMMHYINLKTLCDASFLVFLVSWLVTRQILFLWVIYSAYYDAATLLPFAWEPERGHFLNRDWYNVFLSLLIALQIILCIWFWMICRIFYKVLSGHGAEDIRSDEEGESPEEDYKNELVNGATQPAPTSGHDLPKMKNR